MQLCGLIAFLDIDDAVPDYKSVTLKSSSVDISIRGFVAHINVDLVYKNIFDKPVEVSYTCPVDAKAAIYHFEAQLDKRTIIGHCLEKAKAEKLYKDAVNAGKTAFIASEDELTSDILHLSLGNLGKGEEARLNLKMVMELPVEVDGSLSFVLPTVFNPRYSPSIQEQGPSSPVIAYETGYYEVKSPYSMNVKAEVLGCHKIASVTSKSDDIAVVLSEDDTVAQVTMSSGTFKCDHDWGFQIHYHSPYKPHVLKEVGDCTSTGMMADDVLMINMFPEMPLEAYSPDNEIIFLVDCSGSMQGERIGQAKSTLFLFLKSLPPGCRFNIVCFGSNYKSLFSNASEEYTESRLEDALKLQRSLGADMGGTEIFPALQFIYSQEPFPGFTRKILVLTDGAVWNVKQILDLVARQSKNTQVFSIGIGEGASTALVRGLATAGKGRFEMVLESSQLQLKVMGLMGSMLQKNFKNLSVVVETEPPKKVTLIPNVPPVIFGGQHLILFARVPENIAVKSVLISGKVGSTPISWTLKEEDCKTAHDTRLCLHRLAAKCQLNYWEINATEGVEDQVVSLSIASGVICSKTAIIGIDQEGKVFSENKTSPPAPCFDVMACISQPPLARSMRARKFKGGVGICSFGSPAFEACSAPAGVEEDKQFPKLCSKRGPQITSPSTESADVSGVLDTDVMMDIVSAQNFDGSWNYKDCFNFINLTSEQTERLNLIRKEFNLDDLGFATMFCLALLSVQFASRNPEWKLIAIKANMFIEGKGHTDAAKIIQKFSEVI